MDTHVSNDSICWEKTIDCTVKIEAHVRCLNTARFSLEYDNHMCLTRDTQYSSQLLARALNEMCNPNKIKCPPPPAVGGYLSF